MSELILYQTEDGKVQVKLRAEDGSVWLSQAEMAELFSTTVPNANTQADQLFFDQIQEEAIESETLRKAAASNSKEDFRYVFEKAFEGLVIDRMDGPPRQNSCRLDKILNSGAMMRERRGAIRTGIQG